jgi:hypothetical protein
MNFVRSQYRFQAISKDWLRAGIFHTRDEAENFLGGQGMGEIRKWRVLEPDRLVGMGRFGETCRLWGHEDSGKVLATEDIPEDRYFYHNTDLHTLHEVRRHGLRASLEEKWRLKQYGEPIPPKPEHRLYLFTRRDDCLAYAKSHFDFDRRAEIFEETPLRFRRSILVGQPLFFDGRYDGSIFSIYVKAALIATSDLEYCTKWWKRWKDNKRHFAGRWMRLVSPLR